MKDKDRVHIFGESRLDFKYRKFLAHLTDFYQLVRFKDVLRLVYQPLERHTRYYFHIRYLKWRGYFFTLPYYLLVVSICKLRSVSIIYTCHNFWEHNYKSRMLNKSIRRLLVGSARDIIVLDENIGVKIQAGREALARKIHVVHFSDFSDFFESQVEVNLDFQNKYLVWLKKNNIKNPDVLLVSSAYRTLEKFKPLLNNSKSKVLCIVPNLSSEDAELNSEHVMIYKDYVKKEVRDLLKAPGIVGLVGLDNGSVATSLYMFASYGIPCLVLEHEPMNSLILKYELGVLFKWTDSIDEKLAEIKSNFSKYKAGGQRLLNDHTWEKSNDVHRQIFSV